MNDTERTEALDRLRGFAGQQADADDLADRDSIDRAADIMALYDDRDENGRRKWVLEMGPLKTRRHMGRPVDPESFSRFTKWLVDQAGVQLPGRYAYRLKDAHEIASTYLAQGQLSPPSERSVRPLKWMLKNEHQDAIGQVWRDACERADETPTQKEVREALAAWKKDHVPKPERSGATVTSITGPQAWRLEMERLARQLMESDPEQFLLGFDHIDAMASKRFGKTEVGVG